jgi:hypothetical protein
VVGQSPAKADMVDGPYMNFPKGDYAVDFYLRAQSPMGNIATIAIYDADGAKTLGRYVVTASDFSAGSNQWARVSVPISVGNASNSLAFELQWLGSTNLDLATIRLR